MKMNAPEKKGAAAFVAATPAARRLAEEKRVDLTQVRPTGAHGEIRLGDVRGAVRSGPRATSLARAAAEKLGIDLKEVSGTGFGGRITKQDVLLRRPAAAPEKEAEKSAPVKKAEKGAAEPGEAVPMNAMRRVVARRMSASHTEIPPVTQCTKVDVTKLLALREQINGSREKSEKISVNDLVLKAVAKTLPKFARFRMTLEQAGYVCHDRINIGMAVGLEDGLVVPVIRDAVQKSLEQISQEARLLARKARGAGLSAGETGDARITVTNLGMFGTYCFTPIINQPEAAIIGVCSVEDELCMTEGKIEVRKKMMICVTYDHRIINGMESSLFQCALRDMLENPIEILL